MIPLLNNKVLSIIDAHWALPQLLLLKERTQENLHPILVQPQQQQGIEIASFHV